MNDEEFRAEWKRLEGVFADFDHRLGRGILVMQLVAWSLIVGAVALMVWAWRG